MRPVNLNVVEGGISRLRVKGRASEKTLYDAVNCHITADNTVVVRPGTVREYTLPEDTYGLCSFNGQLHTFATEFVDLGSASGIVVNIITHPEQIELDLQKIHFAQPFLGALYVVAEFENGDVFHYWLQETEATVWEAETVYTNRSVVRPTTRNGFAYRGRSLVDPPPAWSPEVPREVGARVTPTEFNGFYYEVTDVFGDNPRSGPLEPEWPTLDGQIINEDSEAEGNVPPRPPQPPTGGQTPPEWDGLPENPLDRYRFGLP